MYQQMNHLDLIASTPLEYTQLVLKLFSNHTFQQQQSKEIAEKFRLNIHQNYEVMVEWLEFMTRITRSMILDN